MAKKITAFNKLHRKNGIVFVTVLMIIIVMMVLTVTILSLNIGQVMTTEGEVQRLQAQELARGMIFYTAGAAYITNPTPTTTMAISPGTETLGGIAYTPTANVGIAGSGIGNTRTVDIDIVF